MIIQHIQQLLYCRVRSSAETLELVYLYVSKVIHRTFLLYRRDRWYISYAAAVSITVLHMISSAMHFI